MTDIDKLENMALLARSGFDWQDRLERYTRELFRAAPALIAEVRRLRAIEAAAVEHARVCDLLRKEYREEYAGQSLQTFAAMKAALAAKGTP